MEKVNQPFEFKLGASLLRFTGKKAKNLRELRQGIANVSQDSLFHHTCQYLLKGPVQEYTNDFAHWAGESLEERALSEHLSNIDPYFFYRSRTCVGNSCGSLMNTCRPSRSRGKFFPEMNFILMKPLPSSLRWGSGSEI